ncbi:MAG: formate dehydrogenase subunit gamma [Paracoccus sp. (in: a-proteobacteria)]|jgi:formate dehydrogenase subunit gamma|uniref:formate dehydrogenase subunit gamma n=1 Tax=unclassified Paracoccus (in: a-proteobacteria) TaxID=2688777 RepID=UPI000C54295E|nr:MULTISPECIES: formate dehydrogenase subunit gamma [unclassified Paracoccus (in: a-proteobacteria)]MAN57241.1 formate dehydrogenase subunit gamma [Paracoccus sp. (in: a-proteobacteria)]|tara:strand:+ start:4479 stop:4955 length:477 start_codon:yes stop_codon:yes gene_type:complete
MHHDAQAPTENEIRAVAAPLASLEGPLLPMLHAVQHEYGCVPEAAVPVLADLLNLSRAEVHGVVSFYHDFRKAPAGKHILRLCRAEACQSMGGQALAEATLARLGIGWHDTTANGAVTVEPVYCLGLCACAPAAMLDDRVVARLDAARLDRLLAEAGA